MQKQGYTWKDFAVAGGAGAAAMTALKTQVISGNAPSAAQIKGPLIQEWAQQGVLVPIDSVAGDWKKNLPPPSTRSSSTQTALRGSAVLGAPRELALDQQGRTRQGRRASRRRRGRNSSRSLTSSRPPATCRSPTAASRGKT
jgi:hypothetical protein